MTLTAAPSICFLVSEFVDTASVAGFASAAETVVVFIAVAAIADISIAVRLVIRFIS
ncbi:MAG: hypothetical protein NC131_12145 [Roseburia sp.]|nr:hypothetical protein [Roseburia sp.]